MTQTRYTPLHVHSHNSLLDGLSKTSKIIDRLCEIGSTSGAITDHGSLSGNVDYFKDAKKKNIKPLLGCELYISEHEATKQDKDNRSLTHLCVIAKNKRGWQNLIKAVSASNKSEHFYHRPRLSLKQLEEFSDDLIAISGHLGSHLADCLFSNPKLAYRIKDESEVSAALKADAKNCAIKMVEQFKAMFGNDNFFLEVQLFDKHHLVVQKTVTDLLRDVGLATNTKCIATPDAHYAKIEDAYDQRILLCSALQTTFPQIEQRMASEEDVSLGAFFKSNMYYIPSYQDMVNFGHTEEELANTNVVSDMVESYDILSKPLLPEFPCPQGFNPDDYLRQLCREGWKTKIANKIPKSEQGTYVDRVKYELSVLQGAGLSSYFLILNDICSHCTKNGWLTGVGRGSAAGCLVSYLVDITQVDPIKYSLLFERFYNAGRNTKDRVSMPDIDLDVPSTRRDDVIKYIKNIYGESKVGQISAFQTMKGRGAMKEVLRAYGTISFEMMNKITEHIPDESKIIGDLQIMKEEEGESSIIKWALENDGDKFSEWCQLNDDGTLTGPLSKRFEQAIRLEGTRKSYGKHASGIVIATEDIGNIAPLILDKDRVTQNVGWEMIACEDAGLIKLDILGINLLTKVQGVADILKTGDIAI